MGIGIGALAVDVSACLLGNSPGLESSRRVTQISLELWTCRTMIVKI
jgi:hypothetical protein